jgi:hypothetical protein
MAECIEREAAVMRLMQDGCSAKNVQTIMTLPAVDVEKISDGYHTFADLYEQRLILSAALAKNNPHAWKSKRHEDGSVPFGGGWFIMGFDTDEGCYTYHYELKDWDLFQCKELDKGKPWDGHTSRDVRRLLSIPTAVSVPQWISVKERLPKAETQVLVTCSRNGYRFVCPAIYEDGTVLTQDSIWNWYELENYGTYSEENDDYFVPEGWWENRQFTPDDIYNSPVDCAVTHWMPLPEPPKGDADNG